MKISVDTLALTRRYSEAPSCSKFSGCLQNERQCDMGPWKDYEICMLVWRLSMICHQPAGLGVCDRLYLMLRQGVIHTHTHTHTADLVTVRHPHLLVYLQALSLHSHTCHIS